MRPADVAELETGDPRQVAVENARLKARAAAAAGAVGAAGVGEGVGECLGECLGEEVVIGCDTIVVLDGVIYGKPPDEHAARRTLGALGGRTHEVLSGLAVAMPDGSERETLARTLVTFREIGDELLEWYVQTEEWRGRSGGYAIQGAGSRLATKIEGEEDNVVGLPLGRLIELCPELCQA